MSAGPTRLKGGYADCLFGQIHFLARHPAGATKPALVLLNPRSRSCQKLLPFLPPDQPVYIVDIPCLGMSSPVPKNTTMPEVAQAVAQFIELTGIGASHIYGIHTGGKVAAAVAAHYPEQVLSLTVCGKSHSIIPGLETRNSAMKDQAEKPDSLILRSEGKFLDDIGGPPMALLYEANFAFDLASAMAACKAPALVIEITSPDEDVSYGRQGSALARHAPHGKSMELPQTDATGLDFYTGAAAMAKAITAFIATA